ncbi:39S ribosomal protein L15, mitochondrial [Chionoecetes opilio]|uniref:39S ribosomal protein L15, mitochondrial n=1 Tax=Chionoecetes opilio TaxID=41210 RepID=A0A8J4YCT3_CHIOP|nr:39S ribosomal protein L15, mitochondrial [Chionoecetes opilio]
MRQATTRSKPSLPHAELLQRSSLATLLHALCMGKLQRMIDTARLRTDRPVDVSELTATGLFSVKPYEKEEASCCRTIPLQATVNLEGACWASEALIAAVERNGGTITVAYYDPGALLAAVDPWPSSGEVWPIPRRMLPPQNLIDYYSDPKNRGYLADLHRWQGEVHSGPVTLSLALQKYGYALPDIRSSPHKEMLLERKDPRQIFYGLQPGWVVSLKDKLILKPTDPELQQHYAS